MDEKFYPGNEHVKLVLDQETSALRTVLTRQSQSVIMQLCQTIPSTAGLNISHPVASSGALTDLIKTMLDYLHVASAADCCNFLQSFCMICDNIPMHLESRLLSVAGYPTDNATQSPTPEPVSERSTDTSEISSPTETEETSSLLPSDQHPSKRPRFDYWGHYIVAVRSLLLRRWEQLSEHLVTEVQLENIWVSPVRMTNRGRDRPDQTPGTADRGNRTPEADGDYMSMESRVTFESFLQGCAGKITILIGQSGSGKTLLMSRLGQQWARQLGPIPSTSLFVLLEFRQLNLVSHPLSLSQLLFQYYLPPIGGDEEKRAIVDYLLSNPEQCCWVLDGYDEFHSKITKQEVQTDLLHSEHILPVAELISGLLNRQLLPGCTVVVTCRARDVADLEGIPDKVGQLLGWDSQAIKEYVHNFFRLKGNTESQNLGMQAGDLLLSTPHLLAMSSLPAHCNICCICLEHLLLKEKHTGGPKTPVERRNETRTKVEENEDTSGQIPGGQRGQETRREGNCTQRGDLERGNEDVVKCRTQLLPAQAQIPTLTQVYLTVLVAFLSRQPDITARKEKPETMTHQQSTVWTLAQCPSELCVLSQLALNGLEVGKILFMEEDISPDVLKFAIRTGLFSKVELRREGGLLVNSYCFIHLTMQEFLAALRIMTSPDVSAAEVKNRVSLKSRWMNKANQRTVFTDSLHLYMCGLASPQCTQALVQLATACGATSQTIKNRQAQVKQKLKNLCLRGNTLTGPKILELCHCVQESQDHQLAQDVMGSSPTLELRNIWLLPNDIYALAFVVNSVGDNGIGLVFGACSMELECLEVLPKCQYIHCLRFHGRKYGDKFAEKLSSILPELTTLRKLEFCAASLTATGATSLVSALQKCPNITEINLSDNNLKDAGIEQVADIFTKLPGLVSIMLGRNNSSLKAVDYLIGKMSSSSNIEHIHANGVKELTITFSKTSNLSNDTQCPRRISLLDQKWSVYEMQKIAESLTRCHTLSVMDLSGGQWDVENLRVLTQNLPKFNVTEKIILNDSCFSVKGLAILTALLADCPAVMELHVRLQSPVQVSVVFSGGQEKPVSQGPKMLCLSFCGLRPADLQIILKSLGTASDLMLLDLSNNSLGNKGLRKLLDVLPHLSGIQQISIQNNGITMEGIAMLAGALCFHNNLTQILISHGGKEKLILKFSPDERGDTQKLKILRINNSSLQPSNVTTLCKKLIPCPSHLELDLSHSLLSDKAVEGLLKFLPEMTSLQRLNVSYSITSTAEALALARCLTVSQRVVSLELRTHSESLVLFDSDKAKPVSCRLTHVSLNGDNLKRLLQTLLQGPHLSDLDLSSNQLDDDGVKAFLDSLPKLKITSYVNLSNNSLTQQGLLAVANTLCTCAKVSAVDVSLGEEKKCLIWFTQSGDCEKTLSVRKSSLDREHLVTLAEVVSHCPSLTKVELKNNLLDSDGIAGFVRLLKGNEAGLTISIEEQWITPIEGARLMSRCLDLNSNIHTVRVHFTTLHLSLKTTELTASSDSADKHCAVNHQVVQRCPFLKELHFSHFKLSPDVAEFLCSFLPSLPNLRSLSIGSKETCVIELSLVLQQITAIQCLNLLGLVISDAVAEMMALILPRQRSLSLSQCVWSATGSLVLLGALGECGGLEVLGLDTLSLNEEGMRLLAQTLRSIKSIRCLKLNNITTSQGQSGANVLDLLSAMEGLTQMEELELDEWRMAETGVEKLIKLLPVWTLLRKISLSKNLISDQTGDKLVQALNSCSQLKVLNLSGNSLGDLTTARMALVLPSLTHITMLDVSENRVSREGAVSLARAITCMRNLSSIHLTSVGTSELQAVAASLACCPLIQDVGLGWNSCGDEVVEELARVLPLCQKTTRIDLEANRVSVCGAEFLLRAAQSCPALQLIRLWRNQISPTEAGKLSLKDRRLNFSST